MNLRRHLWLVAILLLGTGWWFWPRRGPLTDLQWRELVEQSSEEPRTFLPNNWISHESDYGELVRNLDVRGGVYVGVGPEQNFSYLAQIQPNYAFLIDIRRGNLLQHLYYKVLFEQCPTPQQWLAALCSRRVAAGERFPEWLSELQEQPIQPGDWLDQVTERGHVLLSLTPADERYLAGMQAVFQKEGLKLTSRYRSSDANEPFPSLRQVLSDRGCFLASSERYQRIRTMQIENRVVPLIGDLAGRHAVPSVARWCRQRRLQVSAVYTSNLDFYLMPRGLASSQMEDFVWNLESLPRQSGALLLRFHLWSGTEPLFWPRLHLLGPWIARYLNGDLPDYSAALEQGDQLSGGKSVRPR